MHWNLLVVDLVLESFRHSGHHCECPRKRTASRMNTPNCSLCNALCPFLTFKSPWKDCHLLLHVPIPQEVLNDVDVLHTFLH